MGDMISKPDANPIIFAVLNVIVCGFPIGYLMMGQTKKALGFCIAVVLLGMVTAGLGSFLVAMVAGYDAYLLGQKLASGQSIGLSENGLAFLDSVFKD